MRPCSGAIIVLVFSLSQGLILVGVASTLVMGLGTGPDSRGAGGGRGFCEGPSPCGLAGADSPAVARCVRGFEIAAAAAVLLFGLVLLGGALANGLP